MNMHRQIPKLIRATLAWFASLMVILVSTPIAEASALQQRSVKKDIPAPPMPAKVRRGTTTKRIIVPQLMLSEDPSDVELSAVRLLPEQLYPIAGIKVEGENKALANALHAHKNRADIEDASALKSFLQKFPQSRWCPSLQFSLAGIRFDRGYLTDAIDLYAAAWGKTKKMSDPVAQQIAAASGGELAILYSRLGRKQELKTLLDELKQLPTASNVEQKIVSAEGGLLYMLSCPEKAFKCGPYAINAILNAQRGDVGMNDTIDQFPSTDEGTNLSQLKDLSKKVGLKFQMAKRAQDAPIIVPSVVHWKASHFAAIVKNQDGRYRVKDRTFDVAGDKLISREALDSETDGYFLVPDGDLPQGWQKVTDIEGKSVWGKGHVTVATVDYDTQLPSAPRFSPDSSMNPDTAAAGPGGVGDGDDDDPPCGMAVASVFQLQVTQNVKDTPIAYTTPLGVMKFALNYNNLETNQPAGVVIYPFSNFGPNWSFNWFSYLTVDGSNNVIIRSRGGGSERYKYNTSEDPYPTPHFMSHAMLKKIGTNHYERWLLNGSKEVFDQQDGSGRIFMTEVVDPFGNSTVIQFDANFRLETITDPLGQVSTISHLSDLVGNEGFYRISAITDPFNRSAIFAYDIRFWNAFLTSITDMMGLTSKFTYNATIGTVNAIANSIQVVSTPYGNTTYYKYQPPLSPPEPFARGVRIGYPDGSFAVIESRGGLGTPLSTFYWDREATALYPNDPANQIYTHCLRTRWLVDGESADKSMEPLPDFIKAPLEDQITFKYPGETFTANYNAIGTTNRPNEISRTLDNKNVQVKKFSYNSIGKVTESIDPLGRKFAYTYADNNLDLIEIRQIKDGSSDVIAHIEYNEQHLPIVTVDASGQRTEFTYNSYGQLTQRKNSAGDVWTYTYSTISGGTEPVYLTEIQGPLAGNADKVTLSYDGFGRVFTVTDAEDYTVTLHYGDGDRITEVSYPDGSTEQIKYDKLDAVLFKDRLGRWSRRAFDAMRKLVFEVDPLGRKTAFHWCKCGALKRMTDANGNVTCWDYDIQSRAVQKKYANGTTVSLQYDNAGRVKSRTDALGQVSSFSYNVDDTLDQISYASAVNSTSPVRIAYDQSYLRSSTAQNDQGLIRYFYSPQVSSASDVGSILIEGSPTEDDTVTIDFTNGTLPGGEYSFEYTVLSTDTDAETLAVSLAEAINEDETLAASEITAVAEATTVAVSAPPEAGIIDISPSTDGTESATNIAVTRITLGGTPTADDVVNVAVMNNVLPGGKRTVQYTVQSSDTDLSTLAASLADALNNDAELSSAQISATAIDEWVLLTHPPAVGQLSVATHVNGSITQTLGGAAAVNDKVSILVQDANFGRKTLTYTVASGNGLSDIAAGLATLINGDSDLSNAGITASSSAAVLTITSTSENKTSYAWALNGTATETITTGGGAGETVAANTSRATGAGRLYAVANLTLPEPIMTTYAFDMLGRTIKRNINAEINSIDWQFDSIGRVSSEQNSLGTFSFNYVDDETGFSKGLSRLASIDYPEGISASFKWFPNELQRRLQEIKNVVPGPEVISQFNYAHDNGGQITQWQQQQDSGNAHHSFEYDRSGQLIAAQIDSGSALSAFIGGTVQENDLVSITAFEASLTGTDPPGQITASYTVQSGDNAADVASALADEITSVMDNIGVTASASGAKIAITGSATFTPAFTAGVSGADPTTKVVLGSSSAVQPFSKQQYFSYDCLGNRLGLQGDSTGSFPTGLTMDVAKSSFNCVNELEGTSPGGPVRFDATTTNPVKSAVLNVSQMATIGGTVSEDDVITITVKDQSLRRSEHVSYTVQALDTLSTIASALATAINSNETLQELGVSATSDDEVIALQSSSKNTTTYNSFLSEGATETVTFGGTLAANAAFNSSASFTAKPFLALGENIVSLTAVSGGGTPATETYAVTVNNAAGQSFTHDDNGNMTGDGTRTFKWDAQDRLIEIAYGEGNKTEFSYDALGRRFKIVEKEDDEVTSTKFLVWCGTDICEERDDEGALTKKFFALGQTDESADPIGKSFYFLDHLGSVREVIDEEGTIQAQYSYSPFGEQSVIGTETVASDFGFASMYKHSRSGLNLTLFRAYSPTLGRWLSRDPIGESMGINLYAYVGNSPVNAIDPRGTDTLSLALRPIANVAPPVAVAYGISSLIAGVADIASGRPAAAIHQGLQTLTRPGGWFAMSGEDENTAAPEPCPNKRRASPKRPKKSSDKPVPGESHANDDPAHPGEHKFRTNSEGDPDPNHWRNYYNKRLDPWTNFHGPDEPRFEGWQFYGPWPE